MGKIEKLLKTWLDKIVCGFGLACVAFVENWQIKLWGIVTIIINIIFDWRNINENN